MKNQYIFTPLLLLLIACSTDTAQISDEASSTIDKKTDKQQLAADTLSSNTENLAGFKLINWEKSFPFKSKITCFNEDSVEHFESFVWDEVDGNHTFGTPVIGALAEDIYGFDNLKPRHTTIDEGTAFLYNIQKKSGHTGITLFGGNDAWINQIRYVSFDAKGKKIGDVVLAAHGGDGGYFTRGHGCFINDSTYVYEYVETEFQANSNDEVIIETGKWKYLIRSTGHILKIKLN